MGKIERRLCQRPACCRGCDKDLNKGDPIIYTYSMRNRGQNILFCNDCAKVVGELSLEKEDTVVKV